LEGEFLTRREKIYKILNEIEEPKTAEEIANMLGLSRREAKTIQEDIEYLMKSVKRRSGSAEIIEMIPARCSSCGYVFRDRDKVKRPTKCPRCKSERIQGPWFFLKRQRKI
jgi:predicted Zn-ribbon and HTH transcriptional regulator